MSRPAQNAEPRTIPAQLKLRHYERLTAAAGT